MKIHVCGAAGGEVTGSAYLVQTDAATVLVDIGMFQGTKENEAKNKLPDDMELSEIDAVLLTHGHLDHTGRLPLLVKFGYDNPVYATDATHDLAQIILQDSARLQTADAMRKNKKFWKKGQPPVEPLYSVEHVEHIRELQRVVEYDKPVQIANGISARWLNAGHMLGSGGIELTVTEGGRKKVVLFSGDLGPLSLPLLKPFEQAYKADLVFMESTYGNRNHKSLPETIAEFQQIVKEAVETGAKILVPTFAIGRAQQLIYHLAEMFYERKVKPFPIYLDSPMALKAMSVYREHDDLLDEEFHALRRKGAFPVDPNYFKASPTAQTSRELNEMEGPMMILAGAGMCNGGRILHHLAHNITNPKTFVLIVGFQAYGSLGRKLVDKVEEVRLFGEMKKLNAKVRTLNGFSAHAGQTDLLKWFSTLAPSKPKVCLTHGENDQRKALAGLIQKQFNLNPHLPELNEWVEV